MMGPYREGYDRSWADPEGFWGEAAAAIISAGEPTVVLDAPDGERWKMPAAIDEIGVALDQLGFPRSEVAR